MFEIPVEEEFEVQEQGLTRAQLRETGVLEAERSLIHTFTQGDTLASSLTGVDTPLDTFRAAVVRNQVNQSFQFSLNRKGVSTIFFLQVLYFSQRLFKQVETKGVPDYIAMMFATPRYQQLDNHRAVHTQQGVHWNMIYYTQFLASHIANQLMDKRLPNRGE